MKHVKEIIAEAIFLISALASIFAVAMICFFLFANGLPAIFKIGPLKFLTGTIWKPGNDIYEKSKGIKALVAAIAAGGWVALIVIVIICLIAAVVACFGIFFSSEDTGSDKPMRTVVQEINQEYQAQLDDIKGSVVYDTLEMSGSRAVWPEVLSVYAMKVTSDPDNPQEVATVTPEKEQILRDIFWAMNTISHSTTTESVTTIIESDDGHGNILEETVTETKTTLHIVVSHKTATEMAAEYGFGERQLEHLDALLEEGTSGMWAAVLYGVYGADDQIVQVALTQVGNVGGEPYWSWYGFGMY